MPAIPKPLSEVTTEDLSRLVADGWAEDELLEFKESLPTKGTTPDRWLVDQSEVGTIAKRDVLAEVVGMANSYGGDVVLGLTEGEGLPHRAAALSPLPRCIDLARRFEMFARDHIRPEIPLLAIRGVPIAEDAGVVIIRVPHSASAPHRLEIAGTIKECYKRTKDRTEVMSMREIQDLTLSAARGADLLNRRLEDLRNRHREFCQLQQLITAGSSAIAYTVRAAPLVSQGLMTRVHGVSEIAPDGVDPYVVFANGQEYQCIDPTRGALWRPMLRGTRNSVDAGLNWNLIEISTDGAYLRSVLHKTGDEQRRGMFVGWLLAAIIISCDSVGRFRRYAGAESVEYALEVELTAIAEPHVIMRLGAQTFRSFGDPVLLAGELKLPRYSLGPPEERMELLNLVYEDFWASFGLDSHKDKIVAARL